ncbi:MAG: hypothetical protein HQK49_22395 [Oligoflexia bacterium]|nr:hypothetical protein [Oligoflexia bacterium]
MPRHLFLFDKNNIRILAEEANLEFISTKNLLQPAHWVISIQNILQDSKFKTTLKHGRSFLFTPLIIPSIGINFLQMFFSDASLIEFVLKKRGLS